MAENSGFFNANLANGTYDRVYLAEHFAKYFASFVGNGIFGGKLNELMVIQATGSGMKIEVLSGMGWINGYWYENTSNLSLNIDVADGVLNRIDCVVLRWDKANRMINAAIKKGTFASTAVAPALQRDADIYELKLAEINVKAGTTSITQANIKDTRYDNNVCGLVVSLIKQVDTAEFTKMFKSALDNLEIKTKDEINSMIENLKLAVEDENAFASLILEVNEIASKLALVNQTVGYTKKNLIPYPYAHTTKVDNGITWTDLGDGTIMANGVATANSTFRLHEARKIPGNTILTGGVSTNARLQIVNNTNGVYTVLARSDGTGNGSLVDISKYNEGYIELLIMAGQTVSNAVFKPMLRSVEVIDGTWEPYKLSVTEMIQEDEATKGCFYRINNAGIKEWINPPLHYGVEYCTTQRWENKPVYQKTFYLSTLPNKTITSFATGTSWDKVVSIDAYALDSDDLTYYPFPVILQNQITPIAVISKIESDGYLAITTNADASHLKAYVTVKYTK